MVEGVDGRQTAWFGQEKTADHFMVVTQCAELPDSLPSSESVYMGTSEESWADAGKLHPLTIHRMQPPLSSEQSEV